MPIRRAEPEDFPAMVGIYAASVRKLGPTRYTDMQVDAWAAFAARTEAFGDWIRSADHYVSEHAGRVTGFAGIGPDGYIASLYIHPDYHHRGLATALLSRLFDHARRHGIAELTTAASQFSRPLFERLGFTVATEEIAHYDGVPFRRWRMVCPLDDLPPNDPNPEGSAI